MKSMDHHDFQNGSSQKSALIKTRPTQTKVKHIILKQYLDAWGSIIINGLRHQHRTIRLVYIDCNAYAGRYSADIEDAASTQNIQPIFGTPIIGVQALDSLMSWAKTASNIELYTNAILIEKNEKVYRELKQSLHMAGILDRVRETDHFSDLQNGEIALLCEDSISLAPHLLRYTQTGFKFSLFLLDPYGPTGIPFTFINEIIRQPRHDVIINMPYQDLHKKSGMALKTELGRAESEIVKHYDAMFGHTRWRSIVREIAEKASGRALKEILTSNETNEILNLEVALMHCYREALLSADPKLSVKSIDLHFPDRERTMFYLYLTTHDPSGALKMNEILWNAEYQEHELRWKLRDLKQTANQPTLWELPAPPLVRAPRSTSEEIAVHIKSLLNKKRLTRRNIYAALADESYFALEIDKALRLLKKQGFASFEGSLANDTIVSL